MVFVFGLYPVFLAIVLLVAPNFLLGVFYLPGTAEVWVRNLRAPEQHKIASSLGGLAGFEPLELFSPFSSFDGSGHLSGFREALPASLHSHHAGKGHL